VAIRIYLEDFISDRHCERSEAIQFGGAALDCFVAALLATTELLSVGRPERE